MNIVPIPINADNYAYLIVDVDSKHAAVVDVCEPKTILQYAKEMGVKKIETILTTHDHWDHCAGNEELIAILQSDSKQAMEMRKSYDIQKTESVQVVGGRNDNVPGMNKPVSEGDVIEIGVNINVNVIDTPCHTPGHVCFHGTLKNDKYELSDPKSESHVFTGDTLFVAGCGNFNSGTSKQMKTALVDKLMSLPSHTKVWVGHEYTIKNLQWALQVEPTNSHVQKKLEWAKIQREEKLPTIPSTIEEEKQTNPFMRCTETAVLSWAKTSDPVQCLKIVRQGKDAWGRRGKV